MKFKRPKKPKVNKQTLLADQRTRALNRQKGKGSFIYMNRSKTGSLRLPKAADDGRLDVGPQGKWQGDDYFMFLVKSGDALIVSAVEESKMEEKLILDQPNTVTEKGVVEQVLVNKEVPLNETLPVQNPPKDVLILEDPLDGVEILNG